MAFIRGSNANDLVNGSTTTPIALRSTTSDDKSLEGVATIPSLG